MTQSDILAEAYRLSRVTLLTGEGRDDEVIELIKNIIKCNTSYSGLSGFDGFKRIKDQIVEAIGEGGEIDIAKIVKKLEIDFIDFCGTLCESEPEFYAAQIASTAVSELALASGFKTGGDEVAMSTLCDALIPVLESAKLSNADYIQMRFNYMKAVFSGDDF